MSLSSIAETLAQEHFQRLHSAEMIGCNNADMNTGEIRVTGEDSQKQRSRHRVGAGTSAGRAGEHYVAALELNDAAELAMAEAAKCAAGAAAVVPSNLLAAIPDNVVIPAGRFRMGRESGQDCYDDEFLVHHVTNPQAFAVSRYEDDRAKGSVCGRW